MFDLFSQVFLVVFMLLYSAVFVGIVTGALKPRAQRLLRKVIVLGSASAREKCDIGRVYPEESRGRTHLRKDAPPAARVEVEGLAIGPGRRPC